MYNTAIEHFYHNTTSGLHGLFSDISRYEWLKWDPDVIPPVESTVLEQSGLEKRQVLTITRSDGSPVLRVYRKGLLAGSL